MIPQFTAESALRRPGTYRAAGAERAADGALRPQVGFDNEQVQEAYTFQCPGCRTHKCGFLGMDTCLTCC